MNLIVFMQRYLGAGDCWSNHQVYLFHQQNLKKSVTRSEKWHLVSWKFNNVLDYVCNWTYLKVHQMIDPYTFLLQLCSLLLSIKQSHDTLLLVIVKYSSKYLIFERVKYTGYPWNCHGVPLRFTNCQNAFME